MGITKEKLQGLRRMSARIIREFRRRGYNNKYIWELWEDGLPRA